MDIYKPWSALLTKVHHLLCCMWTLSYSIPNKTLYHLEDKAGRKKNRPDTEVHGDILMSEGFMGGKSMQIYSVINSLVFFWCCSSFILLPILFLSSAVRLSFIAFCLSLVYNAFLFHVLYTFSIPYFLPIIFTILTPLLVVISQYLSLTHLMRWLHSTRIETDSSFIFLFCSSSRFC